MRLSRLVERRGITVLLLVMLSGALGLRSLAGSLQESFDLRVPVAPMVLSVDGVNALVYELHLENVASRALQPLRVEVMNAADGRVLASYDAASLEPRLDRSGIQRRTDAREGITPGQRGIVFIELLVPESMPLALRHRVHFGDTSAGASASQIEGGHTPVVAGTTPVLAPPLRGGPWVAIHDARWERGHRRVGYALGGTLRTPGRHAVDWVKLDDAGRKSAAAGDVAAAAYSHGEDVLAVADGVVSRVIDHLPERQRLSDRAIRSEGNTVVLALANGHYAHYGHLKPGSAVVKAGMRVRAGDKIAEVGFSGSASDPQLHFALTDGPEEMASEGLACTFDRYRLLGQFDDVSRIGKAAWTPARPVRELRASMPGGLGVVRWD